MKWYHDWKQSARNRYLAGYYPGHDRTPNLIVWGLYQLGYFVADFIPLIMNLIYGTYSTMKELISFAAKLLIEASTFIVVGGTIVFSVFHSVELLRWAGATDGLEYIGVLMFEVVFIASTASLTGDKIKGRKTNKYTQAGFYIGIVFVLISNVTQMSSNWIGVGIGIITPILLIVAEGILANQYMSESKDKETQVMEIVRRNNLTNGDVMKAITLYLDNQKEDTAKEDTAKVDTAKEDMAKVDTAKEDMAKVDTAEEDMAKVDTAKEDTKVLDISKFLEDRERSSSTIEEIERVVQKGIEIKKQKQLAKAPGVKRLKKYTGCNEYTAKEAKKVLDKLYPKKEKPTG